MATIILKSDPARPSYAGSFTVVLDISDKPPPFPTREVSIKTTADALAALEAYKAEAAATGKQMAVCMRLKKGDRAPNGYKAATKDAFFHPVNV